jgi:nitrogen regulatory protein PII
MVELVTAIIKPHKLEDVKDALRAIGVQGLTASEVKGFGRQGGHTEVYRGTEYKVDLLPKVKVEILIEGERLDSVVEAIQKSAQTGKIGDGKIWTTPVGRIVRIRTGEMGVDAL